ncbi:MAG: ADP-ribosylglycohydrolase family protein, partial [Acidobacteria bacterium]|nr:ADP-ribosylglycohydrolase family protein [Acidobacteriota bacterium]
FEGEFPKWTPERVSNSLNQDDLYVDMTFAKVLDDKGLGATTADFGAMFREAKYRLWHANLAARRALKRGVPATLSGTPQYNVHASDIDFQIEADFIGMMAPGLPRAANDIALRAGRVMNYGDGIYGGMFVSCMYSAAFFENDPRKIVEAGLASIPARSPYGMLIADVIAWHKQAPNDWKKVWRQLEQKWNKREPCPEGALKPFNIDAKLNGAYIALGLLYGKKDFGQTLEISTRAGQDSDCNPSSAGGILLDARGAGFRLQPVVGGWHRRRHAGLPANSGPVEERHSGHRRQAVRLYGLLVPLDRRQQHAARHRAGPENRRPHRRRHADRQGASAETGQAGTLGRLWLAGRAHRRHRPALAVEGRMEAQPGDLHGQGPGRRGVHFV